MFDARDYFDPELNPGGGQFELTRAKVAALLGWEIQNVMDWEVRSYLKQQAERREAEVSSR